MARRHEDVGVRRFRVPGLDYYAGKNYWLTRGPLQFFRRDPVTIALHREIEVARGTRDVRLRFGTAHQHLAGVLQARTLQASCEAFVKDVGPEISPEVAAAPHDAPVPIQYRRIP